MHQLLIIGLVYLNELDQICHLHVTAVANSTATEYHILKIKLLSPLHSSGELKETNLNSSRKPESVQKLCAGLRAGYSLYLASKGELSIDALLRNTITAILMMKNTLLTDSA